MLTGLKVINLIEERVGYTISSTLEGPDIKPETRKLTNLLNHVLRVLQGMDDWPRLKTNGYIQTLAPITGTCAVSATDVLDNTATWTTALNGAAITFDDAPEYVYTIKSINSETGLTLEEPFIAAAGLPATGYTIAQDLYVLPENFDRPVDEWKSFFGPNILQPLDDYAFMDMRREDNSLTPGEPLYFTLAPLTASNELQVAFHPYPSNKRMYKFRYIKKHPEIERDTDLILFPERQIDAVVQSLIDAVYRDFEDDDRMLRTLQDSVTANSHALRSSSMTERPFIITPARNQKTMERSKWMLRGRRYSYGQLFDIVGFRTRG